MRNRLFLLLFFFANFSYSQNQDTLARSFLDGWFLHAGIGFTNYDSPLLETNYDRSYKFSIIKKIHSHISISSQADIIYIKGTRDLISATGSYDPYNFYEGNGDYFQAKATCISMMFSAKIPESVLSLGQTFRFPKKITASLNIGAGLCNFHSIRYNLLTHTYIYGYGYNDVYGAFVDQKSFWDLPKTRMFIYGLNVDYKINKDASISFSHFIYNSGSGYIDSDNNSNQGDNIINISVGYIATFDSFKNISKQSSSIIPIE